MSPQFLVLYYFQGEPGESIDSPNAFSIPKGSNSNITFGQFLDCFPAASNKGKLHYRFRSDDLVCGYVWQDMGDRNEIVPVSSGIMTCKILCLDGCSVVKRYSRLKLKNNLDTGEEGAAVHRTKRSNQEKQQSNSSSNSINGTGRQNMNNIERYTDHDRSREVNQYPEDDSFEEDDHYQQAPVYTDSKQNGSNSNSNSNQSSAKASPVRKSIIVEDLLDNEDPSEMSSAGNRSRTVTPTAKSTPRPPAAVIQPPPKQYAAPVVEQAQEQDMFHFDAAEPKSSSKASSSLGVSDVPLTREELVSRREAALEGKVKEALEFKQQLDDNSKREAEELEAARNKFEKSLLTWSTNNKEKRNVRTLLTTMHTVLWTGKGNTWKTISLGDVIEPKQVKLQYRKAMLVVHPDRCSALTTETKFIAKRIFEGINEAYQEFLKKESV